MPPIFAKVFPPCFYLFFFLHFAPPILLTSPPFIPLPFLVVSLSPPFFSFSQLHLSIPPTRSNMSFYAPLALPLPSLPRLSPTSLSLPRETRAWRTVFQHSKNHKVHPFPSRMQKKKKNERIRAKREQGKKWTKGVRTWGRDSRHDYIAMHNAKQVRSGKAKKDCLAIFFFLACLK